MENQRLMVPPSQASDHGNRFLDEEFWAGEFAGKELMQELREAVERTNILIADLKKYLDY